jgi:hypothetical protein
MVDTSTGNVFRLQNSFAQLSLSRRHDALPCLPREEQLHEDVLEPKSHAGASVHHPPQFLSTPPLILAKYDSPSIIHIYPLIMLY